MTIPTYRVNILATGYLVVVDSCAFHFFPSVSIVVAAVAGVAFVVALLLLLALRRIVGRGFCFAALAIAVILVVCCCCECCCCHRSAVYSGRGAVADAVAVAGHIKQLANIFLLLVFVCSSDF